MRRNEQCAHWWFPEQDAQLTAYWTEGLTVREIGRRMGKTPGAITGRRKRLGLPGRASPIGRTAAPKPKPPPRVVAVPLPPLPPLPAVVLPETRRATGGRDVPATYGGVSARRVSIRGATLSGVDVAAVAAAVGRGDAVGCRYIAGEPRPVRAGMYCDRPTLPNKPYCAACWAKCYYRRDREQEAAD